MEHEICFFNSTAWGKHQEGHEPIDPRRRKQEKRDFFPQRKEEKKRPGDKEHVHGKRRSRGSTRSSSPAAAEAEAAIAGSKMQRENGRDEREGGRSRPLGAGG